MKENNLIDGKDIQEGKLWIEIKTLVLPSSKAHFDTMNFFDNIKHPYTSNPIYKGEEQEAGEVKPQPKDFGLNMNEISATVESKSGLRLFQYAQALEKYIEKLSSRPQPTEDKKD